MELSFIKLQEFCDHHGFIFESFNEIDSTNKYLKNFSSKDQGMICIADRQTAGQGRIGKTWYSPAKSNIYMSMLMPNYSSDLNLPISLVAAISIVETLVQQIEGDFDQSLLKIKWPNDIMYDGKKLTGILVEFLPRKSGGFDLLVGMGVNVNMQSITSYNLDQPWTSLFNIVKREFCRDTLASAIITKLYADLLTLQSYGFASFLSKWKKYDLLQQNKFRLTTVGGNLLVTGMGVDEQGRLLVKDETGLEQVCASGSVSLALG